MRGVRTVGARVQCAQRIEVLRRRRRHDVDIARPDGMTPHQLDLGRPLVSRAAVGALVSQHRLAAFLQAGLLLPAQDEALTVRATRSALAKLDVEPARLLS